MKTNSVTTKRGSVLLIALLTITILTLICATSLYITTQNTFAGMQTASWQQALTGAESGVDAAIRALNTGVWTVPVPSGTPVSWRQVSTSLPTTRLPAPSPPFPESLYAGGGVASAPPMSGQYNYLPSSALALSMQSPSEGATGISSWVTIDTAQMSPDIHGQWYRIRSTGVANEPAIARNTLGYLDLRFNQKTHAAIPGSVIKVSQVTRTIEVIVKPVAQSMSSFGILSRKKFYMAGNGYIDSFNSANGPYDPSVKTNPSSPFYNDSRKAEVGILDSTGSTLANGTYLYGSLTYSGPAVQNTQNVQGAISTPLNVTVPPVSAPTWASGSYSTIQLPNTQGDPNITTSANGNTTTITVPPGTTATNPLRYQVPSILLSGNNNTIVINPPVPDPVTHVQSPGYIEIWVTGAGGAGTVDSINNVNVLCDLSTSGNNSGIILNSNASAKFYVQGNIYLAGNSITNNTGLAQNLWIYGVTPTDGSTQTAYIAGNNSFIGVVDAPAYNTTYAGNVTANGGVVGAIIANALTIQGNGSLHYDEALNSALPSSGPNTYSFASWFEDNSNPNRNARDQNGNYNPIVY